MQRTSLLGRRVQGIHETQIEPALDFFEWGGKYVFPPAAFVVLGSWSRRDKANGLNTTISPCRRSAESLG